MTYDGKDKRGLAGFTLIELMVVVAIIGVLIALGGNSYLKELPRSRSSEAARQIWGDIHLARSYATKNKVATAIIFYPVTNTYSIIEDVGKDLTNCTPDSTDKHLYTDSVDTGPNKNKKKMPKGIVFAGSIGVLGKDGEAIVDGVEVGTFNCFVFTHKGTALQIEAGGTWADKLDNLLTPPNRNIYVVSGDFAYDGGLTTAERYRTLFGVSVEGISGLPATIKYEGSGWEE